MAQNLQFQRVYSYFKQQMSVVDNMNSKNSVMDRLITSNIRTITVNKEKELSLEQKLTSNDSSANFNSNSTNLSNEPNEMEVETSSNKRDLEEFINTKESKVENSKTNEFVEEQKSASTVELTKENQNGTDNEEIIEIEMISAENKELREFQMAAKSIETNKLESGLSNESENQQSSINDLPILL